MSKGISHAAVLTTYERPGKSQNKDNYSILRALDSIINQDTQVGEIVVVIDGSSEFIKNILLKFTQSANDKQISFEIVETGENLGGNHARNVGIAATSADVISFMDDDDEWVPNKISIITEKIQREKLDVQDRYVFLSKMYFGQSERNVIPVDSYKRNEDLGEYMFVQNGTVQTSSMSISKGQKKATLFDETVLKHQDWDYVLRAYYENDSEIIFFEMPLNYYHTDSSASTSVGRRVRLDFSLEWISRFESYLSVEMIDGFIWRNLIMPSVRSLRVSQPSSWISLGRTFHKTKFAQIVIRKMVRKFGELI